MDRTKNMSVVAAGVAIMLFAAACVAANPQIFSTPLYTLRMEQASNKMNFLPTKTNGFMYTAESGYTLTCAITGYRGGVTPLNTKPGDTYCESCIPETCEETCDWTCFETCPNTCEDTCEGPTCPYTCSGPTCEGTCTPSGCPWTEWPNCEYTKVYPTCVWHGC
ncbi:MAG: hypothetical protein PVF58_06880 [Candidatus Methanofastidiosia archaeon]